jgi:ubiquinone/menaquinone biosynthesis C-methylase UbiE
MGKKKHKVCPWYAAYLFDNPLRHLIHAPAKILGPYIRPGMTVLDVGCGMGFFSLGLARLVGPDGRVISFDIQPQMLRVLERRAKRSRLFNRIETGLIEGNTFGNEETVDFALAFWVIHEVPDQDAFLSNLRRVLRPGSRLFISEPKPHVTAEELEATIRIATGSGFVVLDRPRVRLSMAVLLEKEF